MSQDGAFCTDVERTPARGRMTIAAEHRVKPVAYGHAVGPSTPSSLGHGRMVVLGMDIKDPELPPPTLNLGHQMEQARLDKEDRERQARDRLLLRRLLP